MHRYFLVCLISLFVGMCGIVQSSSFLGWEAISSPHFLLYYTEGFEAKASDLLTKLESRLNVVEEFAGPIVKTTLVLEDTGSISNGYANPLSNKISLWISPPESYGFALYDDWLSYVGIHEVGHIAQLTRKNNNPLQIVLGELFSLNIVTPSWFSEGLSVGIESSYSKTNGRLRDPKTRLITRQLLESDQIKSISNMTSPFSRYPYGGIPYLLGSRFVSYLTTTYGKEKMNAFIYDVAGNPLANLDDLFYTLAPLHSFQDKMETVFGKSATQLFSEWREFELVIPLIEDGQILDNSPYEKQWIVPITDDSFFTFENRLLAPSPGKIVRSYQLVKVGLINGEKTVFGEYKSSMAAKPQVLNENLYIALRELEYGHQNMALMGFGGITKVIKKDLRTGEETDLFKSSLRSFLPLGDSIVYFKDNHSHDKSEVWEFRDGNHSKLGECSILVSEIVNETGRWFVIGKTTTSGWDLYEIDSQSFRATKRTDTPNPEYFLSSTGEGKIIYSALKNKQTNIFELDLSTEKISKLTNSDYAAFSGKVGDALVYLTPGSVGTHIVKTPYLDNKTISLVDERSASFQGKMTDADNVYDEANQSVDVTSYKNNLLNAVGNIHENEASFNKEVMIKKEDAFTSNLLSLLMPFARFIPFTAMGSDHIDSVSYSSQFSSSGMRFSAGFKGFVPFNTSTSIYSNSELENPIVELDTSYLMHRSQTKGIQRLAASLFYQSEIVVAGGSSASYDSYGQLDGMVGVGVSGTYRDSDIRSTGRLKYSLSKDSIGIKGYFAEVNTTWIGEFSSLNIDVQNFDKFTEPVWITGRGGYYYVDEGTVYNFSFYRQVLRLNVSSDDYFTGIGDVYLKLFSDVLTDSKSSFLDDIVDYSYGIALATNLELPIYTIVPLTLDVGIASLKNEAGLGMFVEFDLSFVF
ncbi:hypothetical protein HOG98_07110 [bacterium]|jgi:hypothetical protein|nr:hypothetical protein [bacterium]